MIGFPRHLSQHVGGFVIAERALDELVPVENAAMPDRTVIQWDKDDLEELGLLKVDVLGLGMLTVIRRCFGLIESFSGRKYTIATVPAEDKSVYEMISRADTIGVFPDRVARADDDAAAAQAEGLLRLGDRGRDRSPGADSRRHGAPVSAAPLG